MQHPSALLLRVKKPKNAEKNKLDTQLIESTPKHSPEQPEREIYLELVDSTKTVRARLNAVNILNEELHPPRTAKKYRPKRNDEQDDFLADQADEEESESGDDGDWSYESDVEHTHPSPSTEDKSLKAMEAGESSKTAKSAAAPKRSFRTLRSILKVGPIWTEDEDYLKFYDFTKGTTPAQQNDALKSSTARQRKVQKTCLPKFPHGVLMVKGPAGARKTTVDQILRPQMGLRWLPVERP